ncbi:small acid-soluble spore protein Tlp [Psychrobacillus lasiicapitis]|uniref:Small, acid-soluble spore protein Tlp n=1 Tax=Psychrobacillus lasiicapitis TaxID=1636719 RepID=A0A544T6Z2_9BACI|nr:small acid-soluble spore protein Tlp [Psychrobacillus lasiicapitis]TQR13212.1 small acid-soluble spore protein Tlp [Psychrobacillus lasiicapitis]GGA33518.1 hypothetical protein GCM10011384_23970 [Psychrobacillus lasiicapitis]
MRKNTLKPDNRSDNVEKLQDMVMNTKDNMEAAEELMAYNSGEEREAIRQKNARREKSLEGFQIGIIDDTQDKTT